jgi:DNA-binding transcriptional regulator YdaS (Cro superfamily)
MARRIKTPEERAADIQEAIAEWEKLRTTRGVPTRIARKLGIKPQAVHQWTMVPLDRVFDVARLTGVSRRRLRPDHHRPARLRTPKQHNSTEKKQMSSSA